MTEIEFADIIDKTKKVVLKAVNDNLFYEYFHDIDDVVQEIYFRAYKSLVKGKFENKSKISTWLYTIARNECYRYNKKRKRDEEKLKLFKENLEYLTPTENHDKNIEKQELNSIIANMPEKYSIILSLHQQGYKHQYISDKLDLKAGTVKSRLHRAKKILFEEIKKRGISL